MGIERKASLIGLGLISVKCTTRKKITRLKRVELQFFSVKLHIYDGFDAVVRLSLFGILGAAKNNTTGWMKKKKCCRCDTHSVHFLVVFCITVNWDTQLKVFTTTCHEGQKGGSSIAIFFLKIVCASPFIPMTNIEIKEIIYQTRFVQKKKRWNHIVQPKIDDRRLDKKYQ